jgi:hypothetical protein
MSRPSSAPKKTVFSAVTWIRNGTQVREHLTRSGDYTLCGRRIDGSRHRATASPDGIRCCRVCAKVALGRWDGAVQTGLDRWPPELDVRRTQ